MILAELYGKAPREARASEDMLTSAVWGLLRYLPPGDLEAVLREVIPWNEPGADPPDRFYPWTSISSVEILPWPKAPRSTGGFDECDLLLLVTDTEHKTWGLLVEAKYQSRKSQRAVDEQDPSVTGDQLARYLLALHQRRYRGVPSHAEPVGLIYLTATPAPPRAELDHSLDKAQNLARSYGFRDPRIGWLAWADIEHAIGGRRASGSTDSDPATKTVEAKIRDDVVALLRRRNLRAFHGFTPPRALPSPFRLRFQLPPRLPSAWRPRS